jgi:ATP-dependent helicase HrpA
MPAAEQQRIFAPGPKRRVIVATNIARPPSPCRGSYVIDAAFADEPLQSAHATKRLPWSRSRKAVRNSARVAPARAGRHLHPLYAEDDFAERPRFTQPEIQRANLAR